MDLKTAFMVALLALPVPLMAAEVNAPAGKSAVSENTGDSWDKLTAAEKITKLEKRRADRIRNEAEKWRKMSDAEKISQYEKRRQRALDMRAKRAARNKQAAEPCVAAEPPAPMPPKS